MSHEHSVKGVALMIVACFGFFLVACGVSTLGGQNGAPPTPTVSPDVSSSGGSVTLVLSKPSYAVADAIDVMIHNGRATAITPTGDHTSCTPLTLERFVGGSWQPQGDCQTLKPSQIVDIPAGQSVAEHLRPTNNRGLTTEWAAGTYKVSFEFSQSDSVSSGAIATVQSSQFTVG